MNNIKRILIIGLNNSGKSTLAEALKKELNAVVWNGDSIRNNLGDFDFSIESRLKQARRIKYLSDTVMNSGNFVICDFIAPIEESRSLFYDDSFIIWMNTVRREDNEYKDTGLLWQDPKVYHMVFDKLYKTEDMVNDVLVEFNYFNAKDRSLDNAVYV